MGRVMCVLAVVIFTASAIGVCAPAHAMSYVGPSRQAGYSDEYIANATFCLKAGYGTVKYFTVKKGVHLHARGEEGNISFKNLFTGVKNGKNWSYATNLRIFSSEFDKGPNGPCPNPGTPILG
jgi:hypothetical protein